MKARDLSFDITWRGGAYFVSIPNLNHETVVPLATAEALEEENAKLRDALNDCPWPDDVWPNTVEEAGKVMREAMGDVTATAVSGAIMRHAWNLAKQRLQETAEA